MVEGRWSRGSREAVGDEGPPLEGEGCSIVEGRGVADKYPID